MHSAYWVIEKMAMCFVNIVMHHVKHKCNAFVQLASKVIARGTVLSSTSQKHTFKMVSSWTCISSRAHACGQCADHCDGLQPSASPTGICSLHRAKSQPAERIPAKAAHPPPGSAAVIVLLGTGHLCVSAARSFSASEPLPPGALRSSLGTLLSAYSTMAALCH